MAKIDQFLRLLVQHGGSDLHLSCGSPPVLRIDGGLERVACRDLAPRDLKTLVAEILSEEQSRRLEESGDLDFGYEVPGLARFRGNCFRQQHGPAAVFRAIASRVPTADELQVPETIRAFTGLRNGLVLVTGPTGSGKSSTLASLIDLINQTRAEHILTIEDPIEFVHRGKCALINQREVGRHTNSFAAALKAALREDPDVILLGEMRDRETISLALTAAETGHLVFGTLHTNSAHKTIDRIIDTFPGDLQEQVRAMLAETLRGVVCQQLLRKKGGKGRVAAHEILVANPAVANLIREGKTFQLPSLMQTGKRDGMVQMDQCILDLLAAGMIDGDEARSRSQDRAAVDRFLANQRPLSRELANIRV